MCHAASFCHLHGALHGASCDLQHCASCMMHAASACAAVVVGGARIAREWEGAGGVASSARGWRDDRGVGAPGARAPGSRLRVIVASRTSATLSA